MKKSGALVEDKVRLATVLYNKAKVEHPRSGICPVCRFMNPWKILHDLSQFSAASTSPKSHASGPSQESDGFSESTLVEGTNKKRQKELVMPDRPEGRRKTNAAHFTQVLRAEYIKLEKTSIRLREKHVLEIKRRNEMLLFSSGPGGSKSENSKR